MYVSIYIYLYSRESWRAVKADISRSARHLSLRKASTKCEDACDRTDRLDRHGEVYSVVSALIAALLAAHH